MMGGKGGIRGIQGITISTHGVHVGHGEGRWRGREKGLVGYFDWCT